MRERIKRDQGKVERQSTGRARRERGNVRERKRGSISEVNTDELLADMPEIPEDNSPAEAAEEKPSRFGRRQRAAAPTPEAEVAQAETAQAAPNDVPDFEVESVGAEQQESVARGGRRVRGTRGSERAVKAAEKKAEKMANKDAGIDISAETSIDGSTSKEGIYALRKRRVKEKPVTEEAAVFGLTGASEVASNDTLLDWSKADLTKFSASAEKIDNFELEHVAETEDNTLVSSNERSASFAEFMAESDEISGLQEIPSQQGPVDQDKVGLYDGEGSDPDFLSLLSSFEDAEKKDEPTESPLEDLFGGIEIDGESETTEVAEPEAEAEAPAEEPEATEEPQVETPIDLPVDEETTSETGEGNIFGDTIISELESVLTALCHTDVVAHTLQESEVIKRNSQTKDISGISNNIMLPVEFVSINGVRVKRDERFEYRVGKQVCDVDTGCRVIIPADCKFRVELAAFAKEKYGLELVEPTVISSRDTSKPFRFKIRGLRSDSYIPDMQSIISLILYKDLSA